MYSAVKLSIIIESVDSICRDSMHTILYSWCSM